MAAEKVFENKVKRFIEKEGGWQVKFFANSFTKSGIPDLLCCINGHFVAIEVKAQNGHPSDLQLYNCTKIREAWGFAFVLYPSGFEKFQKFVSDLNKGTFNRKLPIIMK